MTTCHACLAQANQYAPGTRGYANHTERAACDWPVKQINGLDVHLRCASEVEHLASVVADMAVSPAGVLTWISNNRVLMLDTVSIIIEFGFAPGVDRAACKAAHDTDATAFFAAYRAAQPAEATPEERYELTSAFGPGQTVVNVITGRRTRT